MPRPFTTNLPSDYAITFRSKPAVTGNSTDALTMLLIVLSASSPTPASPIEMLLVDR